MCFIVTTGNLISMTTWFGESWGAPVNDCEHVQTPVGKVCGTCGEPIGTDSNGIIVPHLGPPEDDPTAAFHIECFVKSIRGDDTI